MDRNPFIHAPAPDEDASLMATVHDVLQLLVIAAFVGVVTIWLPEIVAAFGIGG